MVEKKYSIMIAKKPFETNSNKNQEIQELFGTKTRFSKQMFQKSYNENN